MTILNNKVKATSWNFFYLKNFVSIENELIELKKDFLTLTHGEDAIEAQEVKGWIIDLEKQYASNVEKFLNAGLIKIA